MMMHGAERDDMSGTGTEVGAGVDPEGSLEGTRGVAVKALRPCPELAKQGGHGAVSLPLLKVLTGAEKVAVVAMLKRVGSSDEEVSKGVMGSEGGGGGDGLEGKGGEGQGVGGGSGAAKQTEGVHQWALDPAVEGRLRGAFEAMDLNRDGRLSEEERGGMRQTLTGVLMECGMALNTFDGLGSMSWEGFRNRFVMEWETTRKEQALGEINVRRAVAECVVGGSEEEPLRHLMGMSDGEMERWCREELASAVLVQVRRQRGELLAQEERKAGAEDGKHGNGKYGLEGGDGRVATFGTLKDFHEGIAGKLG